MKEYIKPDIEIVELRTEEMLATRTSDTMPLKPIPDSIF